MTNYLKKQTWFSNIKQFGKKLLKNASDNNSKENTVNKNSRERNLIEYKTWRQNWIVFKFIVRLFFSDYIGVTIILIFPIVISVIYLILFKVNLFNESLFGQTNIAAITKVKIWFEFLIYTIGFAAFIYMAVSIADIKYTILYKKMVSGFTTKNSLLMLFFILYFALSIVAVLLKFAVLAFYPSFRNKILPQFNWGVFLLGLLMFILTNLSLGMLFSSFKLGSKGILPITIITFFVFLFFAGLWIAPAGIEILFLVKSREDPWKFLEVSEAAKVWRMITLISPLQPSLKMIEAGTENGSYSSNWEISQYDVIYSEFVTHFIKAPAAIADEYYDVNNPSKSFAKELKALAIFDDFAHFKREILTPEGYSKWKQGVENFMQLTYPSFDFETNPNSFVVKDVKNQMEQALNILKNNPNQIDLELKSNGKIYAWFWKLQRPMLYSGTLVPLSVNLGWLVATNTLTFTLWKTNRVV